MKIQVLDEGYVEFIESWGRGRAGSTMLDESPAARPGQMLPPDYEVGIVEAARQSTQGSFRGWEQDSKLLAHLYNHNPKHATPFEFAGMIIEVQAPIFVFREWHRHRTQSYNEMSARYAPLPDLYYRPDYNNVVDRALAKTVNKQAGTVTPPQASFCNDVTNWLIRDSNLQIMFEEHYWQGLAIGVPKEIARNDMPVSHYSRMRASGCLRNWLAFMTLRCDPDAQWEIQQYADAVRTLIANAFPQTHKLWTAEQLK